MEDNLKRSLGLLAKNKLSPELAQLEATLSLSDKLDKVVEAVNNIPEVTIPEMPEMDMPEYPTEIVVTNLPDVQKVEITNLPNEKDDKEQLALLKEIASELKKKEQYSYDIEIDPALKELLKGDTGAQGNDGSPDTPEQISSKINTLDEKIDPKAIKGYKVLSESVSRLQQIPVRGGGAAVTKLIAGSGITLSPTDGRGDVTINASGGGSGATTFETVSKNLDSNGATFNYTGSKLTSVVYAGGVTKTFNYTGSKLTSIVLSGSTPLGIDLTKTLSYTGTKLTGASYS